MKSKLFFIKKKQHTIHFGGISKDETIDLMKNAYLNKKVNVYQ